MKRRILRELGRSQRLAILEILKCSQAGLSVRELATRLSMSYMGVKAHCLSMHRQGYLETWRQPSHRGRPLMYYRLTEKAYELFSEENNALALSLLQGAQQLFGSTAAEKLLMLHFRHMAVAIKKKISGDTPRERARSFAKLRHEEGHFACFQEDSSWSILESHNPLEPIARLYPQVENFEKTMISDVLGIPIHREVSQVAGIYRSVISPAA